MQIYTVEEVFTPTGYPKHTYVAREDRRLEEDLIRSLRVPGMCVSISGPSKSGKTVLIEKVLGEGNYHLIDGGSVKSIDDVWNSIFNILGMPSEVEQNVSLKGGINVKPSTLPVEASGEYSRSLTKSYDPRSIDTAVEAIKSRNWPIVFDDFHYVDPPVQSDISKQFKGLMQRGLKVIFLSVPYRSEDAVRSNTDLQGRITPIDIDYWSEDDLFTIGDKGFSLLSLTGHQSISRQFARESMGSPQIMQGLCLNLCYRMRIDKSLDEFTPIPADSQNVEGAMKDTAAASGSSNMYRIIKTGPRTRGRDRNIYYFNDGTSGDVYEAIFKGISLDPPSLTFDYNSMKKRVESVCSGSSPEGSAIISALEQMAKIVRDRPNVDWVVDYDDSGPIPVVAFPNPYFMLYIRHGA